MFKASNFLAWLSAGTVLSLLEAMGVVSGTVFALCFFTCVWELILGGDEGSSGAHLQGVVA